MKQTLRPFVDMFYADYRSLALFRISIALLVIFQGFRHLPDIAMLFTDAGFIPRSTLMAENKTALAMSVHLFSGLYWDQVLLWALQMFFALGLLLGWKTRWMAFATWFMLQSLHIRNPYIWNGGDLYMRHLLFWSMFVPLGHAWSLDRAKGLVKQATKSRHLSFGTAGLLMQTALLYYFTAILKSGQDWLVDATAVYYALSIDGLVSPFGLMLKEYFELTQWLSIYVLVVEYLAPILLFVPFANAYFRFAGLLALFSIQLGFALSFNIGIFPYVSFIGLLPFIPSVFWDKLKCFAWNEQLSAETVSLSMVQEPRSWQWIKHSLVAMLILLMLLSNVDSLSEDTSIRKGLAWHFRYARIRQAWEMFAPAPTKHDFWYVYVGEAPDGSLINAYAPGTPINLDKPTSIQENYLFKRHAGRKFMRTVTRENRSPYYLRVGRVLLRYFNARAEEPMRALHIFYMDERTLLNGTEISGPKHLLTYPAVAADAVDEVESYLKR